MECKSLLDRIDILYPSYVNIWEDVCNIESPTSYKAGVDAVGNYFVSMAEARGWKVEILTQQVAGNAVCITLNPDTTENPVTLSAHIDTVHPVGAFGSKPVHRDETYIYGPGTTDCKGGAVAAFLAMDALDQCGFRSRPIQLILQTDEETSSKESGKKTLEFMCRKAENSVAFLNAEECTNHTAVVQRKGILHYRFRITGRAAPAALCHEGASAIAAAANLILELEQLKDKDGLTCNCGVISGGTVSNVVAAECYFDADFRFCTQQQYKQAEQIAQALTEKQTVPGCTCTLEKLSERPAMEQCKRNLDLLDAMNRIYAEKGLPVLTPRCIPGGSDAAYTTISGIPTIDSIGVDGAGKHTPNEKARLYSLAEAAKRMAVVAAYL